MRILVLGAGFGGLELTSRLSDEFGDAAEITLIDKSDSFVFGFSKLDVMFGRSTVEHVRHAYADIMRPAVHFVQTAISAIDPSTRTVSTGSGEYSGDVVVVALGADLHPELTPGLVEAGQEFYTVEGAIAAREAIDGFPGGRVVIGLAGTPFKCPPAPSETALLMHDFLTSRGVRESSAITLVMPFSAPIPPSPAASSALVAAFAERDIEWVPDQVVRSLDPDRRVAVLGDGRELDFDLYLGVPIHRAPAVVRNSPLAVDGWVPVDRATLRTAFPDVYAIGDVTSVGTPKAGVFAEGQAATVAATISAQMHGSDATPEYDGRGTCYLEFGRGELAKVDVTFPAAGRPFGQMEGPSAGLLLDKRTFGTDRIARWFARDWRP